MGDSQHLGTCCREGPTADLIPNFNTTSHTGLTPFPPIAVLHSNPEKHRSSTEMRMEGQERKMEKE